MAKEIIAVIIFAFGTVSVVLLTIAGHGMQSLHSISGDSLAEQYYHQVGIAAYGLAGAIATLAFALIAIVMQEEE